MTSTAEEVVASPARPAPGRPPLVDGWSLAIVVLGAALPVANYLNANSFKLVWPATVIRNGIVWVAIVVAAFLGVRLLTRRIPPLPIAAGFVIVNLAFWNFYRWFPYEPESEARRWIGLLIWAGAAAVAFRVAMLLARLPYAHLFLVIFLGFWLGSLLVSSAQRRAVLDETAHPTVSPALAVELGADRPNVYWLMFDEHARGDQLLEHTGSDDSWFSRDLAERGFSVSESSTSAYVQTHMSTTSTLDMDYNWLPGNEYRGEYALAAPIFRGDNPTVATFEANGYRYVGAPDGKIEWAQCPEPAPGRSCIDPLGGPVSMHEPLSYMVFSTPIGSLGRFGLPVTHNDLASVQAGIDEVAQDDQPFFLFAHLLTPHFPHRYEADCSQRSPWLDGVTFTHEQKMEAYANDVQCLDHEIVATVDHILANDPDAVIILQSDHGSQIDYVPFLDLEDTTPAMLEERFGVLNAIRLPAPCRGDSIEGEPLVNTFRLVFACLSGTEPELLEPRHFFPEPGRWKTFTEVELEPVADQR